MCSHKLNCPQFLRYLFYLLDSWRPSHPKLKGLNPELSYTEHESLLKPQKAKEKGYRNLNGQASDAQKQLFSYST